MKEARIYRRLAAYARLNGYRLVTRHAVHDWVKRGLLPRLEPGERTADIPDATCDVVLAICRLRYDAKLGRLSLIAPQLWLRRHPVQIRLVRESLGLMASQQRTGPMSLGEAAESARSIARRRPLRQVMANGAARALALDEVIGVVDRGENWSRFARRALPAPLPPVESIPRLDRQSLLEAVAAPDDVYLEAREAWRATVGPFVALAGSLRAQANLTNGTLLACLSATWERGRGRS